MKGNWRCVVCNESVPQDVIVCPLCAKNLGEPMRARSEDAIMAFKIDKRRTDSRR